MMSRMLSFIERVAAYLQGKGWGSGTVTKEFQVAVTLLDGKLPSLCVDIGGNRGLYTEQILHKFPKCNVTVFEPASVNVKMLRDKFSKFSNVTIEDSAISKENSEATLYSDEVGSGLASLTKRRLDHFGIDFKSTESIKTIRFEDYWKSSLNSKTIDICKIDIEGHELDALMSFGDAINHISIIQFEFGGCNIDTRTFFQDFWYFFQEHKFDLYRISPIGLIKVTCYREVDEFFSTTNYLARRRKAICN